MLALALASIKGIREAPTEEVVPGIGPETAKKLLVKFGSIKGVQEAAMEELVNEVGEKKTLILRSAWTVE